MSELPAEVAQRLSGLSPRKRALLLQQLRSKRGETGGAAAGPAPGEDRIVPRREVGQRRFPVSFSQLREWILDRFEPGTAAYNLPTTLSLEGPLAVAALDRAVQEIVRRHESLRTTFEAAGAGEPEQVVAPELRLPLPLVDLEALAPEPREALARRLAEAESRRGFDLSRGPLLRVTLLRLGRRRHWALLVMHHIVSDGWSLGIFSREMATLYQAYAGGRPSPLPALPIGYPDFAAWQRRRLAGEALEQLLAYWRRQLAGLDGALELPADRPRPPVRSGRGDQHLVRFPPALAGRLREAARSSGASLFMLLVAGLKALLHRYTGRRDLAVGTFIANRNRSETRDLIGFFINTLVLRTDLGGDPGFGDLLARVRDVALAAYAHQDLPFERLLEAVGPERDQSRTPLFQVMCVLQNMPLETLRLEELTLRPVEIHRLHADFDLVVWMAEAGEGLVGNFEYAVDLFDRATVARMAVHLETLLAGAVRSPGVPLSSLPLLTPGEEHQLLREWSRTALPPEAPAPVHHRILARAAAAPDAAAVVDPNGTTWTYGHLAGRALALAAALRPHALAPDTVVALAAPPSPEALAALLAVLQAGAAYLPLDPTLPEERLTYLLQDTQAQLLLTTGTQPGPTTVARRLGVPVLHLQEVSQEVGNGELQAEASFQSGGVKPAEWAVGAGVSAGEPSSGEVGGEARRGWGDSRGESRSGESPQGAALPPGEGGGVHHRDWGRSGWESRSGELPRGVASPPDEGERARRQGWGESGRESRSEGSPQGVASPLGEGGAARRQGWGGSGEELGPGLSSGEGGGVLRRGWGGSGGEPGVGASGRSEASGLGRDGECGGEAPRACLRERSDRVHGAPGAPPKAPLAGSDLHAAPAPGSPERSGASPSPSSPTLRSGLPPRPPQAPPDPGALAYILHTSGSTGHPKGVMIPHRALATFTEAAAHLHRITPGDRVLQFAAWSFDTSAEEIYPTLTRGATLVLKPEGPAAAAELAAFAASRALTVLDLPTAYWHRLLGAPAGLALPPGVRRVILGGEAVSPRALAAWHRQDPPAPGLVNTYGPTEATVVATAAELGRRERASSGRVAIGRPLPGTRTHLVDRRLRPVPPGVAGELLLGGPSLARGYRGRPATTAASFVPDPFSGLPGARLYRTGDLARHRPGGALEFVGRTDEQVKVRGFRIEPGEIAAALARHPGVGEAAVVARRMGGDGPGGGGEHDVRLVAYVVPATGGPAAAPAAGELRRFLQERLPEHMVPAFFVPLDALPLTRHGKLDRRALPAPQAPRPAGAAEIATPRNDTERALVRLWREVLGVERVGVRDNFFELGGDSLLLLRVHEGLAAELGVEIPVLELFRYPTVETLAARLGAGEAQGRSLSEVGSEAALRADRAASRRRQLRRRQPPPRPARRPGSGR